MTLPRLARIHHNRVVRHRLPLIVCALLSTGQAFGEEAPSTQPQELSPVSVTQEGSSAQMKRETDAPEAEKAVTQLTEEVAAEDPPAQPKATNKPDTTEDENERTDKPDATLNKGVARPTDNSKPAPKKPGTRGNIESSVPPVAADVDLSKPVIAEPATAPLSSAVTVPVTTVDESPIKKPLVLLGEEVAPGTSARLSWSPDQNFDGIAVPTPVLVVNGAKPGKLLCLTAAVHGDELNGIEIVRRVLYGLDAKELSGAVIGVPIVNLMGFRRNSRYLPDRRDLNRFFPGSPKGSSASRIAHSFFTQVISECDALVDIHTGSFLRTNLPQLRADMSVPEVMRLTEGFGATAVLHSVPTQGTLRRAAVMAGIPAVTLETGEPSRLQEKEIKHGTKGIQTLLTKLEMTRRVRIWGEPEPVYYQSIWVRADNGGLLFNEVELGQRVREEQLLGTITDPITNMRFELRSPRNGRILGMALNQVVMPGFAAFRIGIPSTETELAQPGMDENTQKSKIPLPQTETAPESEVDVEDENS